MNIMKKKTGRKIQVDFSDQINFKLKTGDQRTIQFRKDESSQQCKLKKQGKQVFVGISTGMDKNTDTAPPVVSKPVGGGGGRTGGRGRGIQQGGQGGGQQGGGQQGGGNKVKVQPQQPQPPQPKVTPQPQQQQQPKAKALYPYPGQTQDELSFKEGDILIIHKKDPGGWWEGELNGKRGWVPANYLEEM